jgi:DNA polymerase beta
MARARAVKTMSIKAKLIQELTAMRDVEKTENQTFKVKAYNNILKQLVAFPGDLNTMSDIDAAKFTGIGKGIRGKIEQVLATGVIHQVEEKKAVTKVLNELSSVHGIGPVKAKELFKEHGINTVTQLLERPELLNAVQTKGLRYHTDMQKRIPRAEMDKHFATLQIATKGTAFEIAGSYRRKEATSGDIDVILCSENNQAQRNLIDQLKASKYLVETLADGPHKFMGVCKLPRYKTFRRIDIMWMEPERFPFALLYFTGSKEFNVRVRNAALRKGYSLNEYGFKGYTNPELRTERDILDFLNVPWLEPHDRK